MRGLLASLASQAVETKTADLSALTWEALFGGPASKSGASVNVDRALQVSTVLACARVLAEGVAQLPLKVYREADDNSAKTPAKDSPVYRLLYRQPNEWMTSFEFRETLMFHAVLTGNAYAYIGRARGKIKELIPLPPGRVTVVQSGDYSLNYQIHDGAGLVGTFPRTDILHLRGPGWNGYLGMDAVSLAREAIGLSVATEETHARLHSNGARPGGLLSVDGSLSEEARTKLLASLVGQTGVHNAFKTMVLDKGATWTPLGVNGVDSQHLQTRAYQIEEICRFLRVFPQMVGYADKTATFASAEAFFLAHVVHSLSPWIERWEEVIARDLLSDDEQLIARFSVQGLLRGDAKSRAEYYASGIVNGWLKRNEARRFEDLDPEPGADALLVPLNMGTAEDQAAAAKTIADTVKSMIGHNGGSGLDEAELETKIGRVLSAVNERRIVSAKDELEAVLASLPAPDGGA